MYVERENAERVLISSSDFVYHSKPIRDTSTYNKISIIIDVYFIRSKMKQSDPMLLQVTCLYIFPLKFKTMEQST